MEVVETTDGSIDGSTNELSKSIKLINGIHELLADVHNQASDVDDIFSDHRDQSRLTTF